MKEIRHLFATVTMLAILSIGFTADVFALVIYDATASSTLKILSVTNMTTPGELADLTIIGRARPIFVDAFTIGNAFGNAVFTTNPRHNTPLGAGDAIEQIAEVEGSVDISDGFMFSESFSLTNGRLSIRNTSLIDTFEIGLTFDWSYEVTATVGLPDEMARAEIFITLQAIFPDGFLGFDAELDSPKPTFSNTVLGGGTFSATDKIPFTITLAPRKNASLLVTNDAVGTAEVTPEPASLLLLVVGILGIIGCGWLRRRRSFGADSSDGEPASFRGLY